MGIGFGKERLAVMGEVELFSELVDANWMGNCFGKRHVAMTEMGNGMMPTCFDKLNTRAFLIRRRQPPQ